MKLFFKLIILNTFLLFQMICLAQEKRALIIAIGSYNYQKTKWQMISSGNDIPLITDALTHQGFDKSNIKIISDEKATKQGIVAAFEDFNKNTSIGDMVYIHFSGHGQQIQDDNGDEVDGFDESLIPIDACQNFVKGAYEGQNHLRDDDVGKYLESIRKNAGPTGNVLVVIDACHSGTSTRGGINVRGTMTQFVKPDYKFDNQTEITNDFGLFKDNSALAPLVCFYAAASHQLNYEYRLNDTIYVGPLSYAFSSAFSEATNDYSYKGLFDRICVIMSSIAPNQLPQAEGMLNQKIFGGRINGSLDYAKVIKVINSGTVLIDKGQLHGLNAGSKVGFYDVDTKEITGKTPKITGTISVAYGASSQVILDKKSDEAGLKSSWVYVTEQNFGDMLVKVKLDMKNVELADALRRKISGSEMIKEVSKNYDINIEEIQDGTIKLITSKEQELLSLVKGKSDNESVVREIIDRIKAFSQSGFLRKLEVENKDMDASLEIIPVKLNENVYKVKPASLSEKNNKNNIPVFSEGDNCKFRITNTGKIPVYFTLLDIQPDDQINILIPEEGRSPDEFRLMPGKSYESAAFQIYPPYGTDVFKLVTSETPLDLASVAKKRGAFNTRGATNNPFQILFAETYKSESSTRGNKTDNVPPGAVCVKSLVFYIKK